MQYIDQPKSGRSTILSPELAVVSGRIRTDSVDDLRRFERAFPFDPRQVVALAQDVLAREDVTEAVHPSQARRLLSPKEKSDIVFKELLPRVYTPRAAPGWSSDLYFNIEGAGDYTVSVKPDGIRVAEGKVGKPDANVAMDAETFAAVMRFETLDDANQMDGVNVFEDEDKSEELTDDQLELVAGGKGSTACSSDTCGAAAGAGTACGAAATAAGACAGQSCVAAAGVGVCAADACGAAVCAGAAGAGTACGGAACAGAAGAGTACAALGCAAAAAAGSACGAAACAAAACAGDACGAAACAAAACAGNACGADVAPGPDIGPCAINVIPFLPFI